MHLRKSLQLGVILSLIFLCSHITERASGNSLTTEIKSTIDGILDILRDKNLASPSNKEKRRTKMKDLVRGRFDFEEMAKRSLARHWNDRTPEERKNFVALFSDLIETSYIGKIESYSEEKITYDREEFRGDKYGSVSTTIISPKVDIPIEYKVIKKDGKWFVYDVVIEGVSFISTYRSQYNRTIVRESYAYLIQEMKSKVEELNNPPVQGPSTRK